MKKLFLSDKHFLNCKKNDFSSKIYSMLLKLSLLNLSHPPKINFFAARRHFLLFLRFKINAMQIVENKITNDELKTMALNYFGDMVKAVADINRKILCVDAELHADMEQYLLSTGSRQSDLWGINLYPDEIGDDFIEFDSMINIRPYDNNRSRDVESQEIKNRIIEIVNKKIER